MNILSASRVADLPKIDGDIFESYLTKLEAQSPNSASNFVTMARWYYTDIKVPILDITIDDVKSIHAAIKRRASTTNSCNTMRTKVMSYYRHALRELASKGIIKPDMFRYVENPFKASKGQQSETGYDVDFSTLDDNVKSMSMELMDKILHAAKVRSLKEYTYFLLEKYTGMRESEIITIRVKNIDYKQRIIVSGLVKGAAKEGMVIHPFPEEIVYDLRKYVATLPPNCPWLFPGRSPSNHVANAGVFVWNFQQKTGISGWTSHQFRHTIVFLREKMGCPDHVNEFLQNQAVTGTQAKYYRERNFSLQERRELYDKWNPFKAR